MSDRFVPPSASEVTEYAKSIQFNLDGEKFCDYYESVGWVVGGSKKKMKNWQAAVRTWKRQQQGSGNGTSKAYGSSGRTYD